MKIFLTGGTGFIGKNLYTQYLEKKELIHKKILNGFVVILVMTGVKNYLNQIY